MVMIRSNDRAGSRFYFPKVINLLLLALVTFAAATNAANDRVGVAEAALATLAIYPEVSFQQLELTVAGNGQRFEQSFGPGEVAVFSLLDYPLPDGQYRYELIASPRVDTAALEVARNDGELTRELARLEQAETYRQVGQFDVVNGEIILADNIQTAMRTRQVHAMRRGGAQ